MPLRRTTLVAASAAITLMLSGPAAGGIVRTHTETFDTTIYRDGLETTVDWNTGAGELRLFPFQVSQTGVLTTSTNATGIAIDGDYAYIADFSSGLLTVDISDPADPVLLSTFPAVGQAVVASGDYVFLVGGGTAGLKIVSVANPSAPTLVGSVTITGANGVAIDGDYAYVADGSSGLRVISISNPASPSIVTTVNTPGSATDIEVNGNYVYLADGATGLLVFEVTNPASPLLIATVDTPGNNFGIDVRGNRVYVSDSTGELQIYDVTNPFTPALVGSTVLSLSGDVFANADRAYVAASNSGIHVVDISDETSPVLLHTFDTTTARDVVVEGNLAYVADASGGMRIIQVASELGEQVVTGSLESIAHAFDSRVAGTFAYIANGVDGLAIIDIADLGNPVLESTLDTPNTVTNLAVRGRFAYLGDGASLLVVNVFSPDSPVLIGSVATPATIAGLWVDGNYVYVGCGASGLRIYNVSNPASPTLVGSYDTPGTARGVFVSGDRAYLADAGNGLMIFNVANPANPTLLGSYSSPTTLYEVVVGGNVAYVANRFSVLVVDVTNPATPTLISTVSVSETLDLGLVGDRLYTPVLVVDVTDPTNPEALYTLDGSLVFGPEPIGSHLIVSYSGFRILMLQQDSFDATRTRGQSSSLPAGAIPIVRARLATSQLGDVDWELTDDGGANWRSATPGGAWIKFPVFASDLRWRTTHQIIAYPPVDANVDQATIDWFYESAESDGIADVPGDQGGSVRLHFGRSGYDFVEESTSPVTGYQIYSRVDDSAMRGQIATAPAPAPIEVRRFPSLASFGVDCIRVLGTRTFVVSGESAVGDIPPGTWEALAWVAATQRDQYTVRVPTNGDSTEAGLPWTTYCITSHTTTPSVWYASEPDSGYSVDNIAPSVPEGLLFSAPAVLSWDPSADEDFAYFSVFGSPDPELDETAVLINHTVSTSLDVSGAPHAFYHLTASDPTGNRSDAASIASPAADAEESSVLPTTFTLRPPRPNPAHGSVELAFELPRQEAVAAGIYDLSGRRVRTLDLGFLPAGHHRLIWDGTDNANRRVPGGVYFVRLTSGSLGASRRLLMVE